MGVRPHYPGRLLRNFHLLDRKIPSVLFYLHCAQPNPPGSSLRERHHRKNATKGDVLSMVSHVDITWNSFLPYLINLADKLESLGFRYVDGSVIVNKEEK